MAQMMPTLGPRVCKRCLHWANWIPCTSFLVQLGTIPERSPACCPPNPQPHLADLQGMFPKGPCRYSNFLYIYFRARAQVFAIELQEASGVCSLFSPGSAETHGFRF